MSHIDSTHLQELSDAGVSIWLDDLSRDRIDTGTLKELIENSCVVGVTTNPSIFSAAIAGSSRYQEDIWRMSQSGQSISDIVTELTTSDVRKACELFSPTYVRSNGVDGRVSIEVEPDLAYDTVATIQRGNQLWAIVDRPNLLIKVPATLEGLPAIEELTAEGISINVTLIFSVERYRLVMEAYLRGLERRVDLNLPINEIHSVASFFVSRIDSEIDDQLDKIVPGSELRGKAAIANAHLAYEAFLVTTSSERWNKLESAGANLQRPLWASTGVKDKSYSSTRYVVELVADHCVNTMPEKTMDAVRNSGGVRGDTITGNFEVAHQVFSDLSGIGIDFAAVVKRLEEDGVAKFSTSWKELLANIQSASELRK